jgi:hypothetical protein
MLLGAASIGESRARCASLGFVLVAMMSSQFGEDLRALRFIGECKSLERSSPASNANLSSR